MPKGFAQAAQLCLNLFGNLINMLKIFSHKYLPPTIFLVASLASWEILVRLLQIPVYVLPGPIAIIRSLVQNSNTISINLQTTVLESVLGFLLGSFVGLLLGISIAESKLMARVLLPYIVGSNAIPIVAVAPLVVLWFGHGLWSKVIVSAFLCFFPLCINAYKGLSETPEILHDLFTIYGASRWEFTIKARFPHAAPFLFAGAKLNATFAVIGAIVAEFIGATSGLGFGMLNASYDLDVPRLWAQLVIAVILGMAFYAFMWLLEFWYLSRHR